MSEALRKRPLVEVLWWSGCPSTAGFVEGLRPLLVEAGLDPDGVILTEVRTEDEAHAVGFVGSPTLRIDGRDVFPLAPDDASALTCRVYHRRDGRVSPTPDPDDVRDALRAAVRGGSSTPKRMNE